MNKLDSGVVRTFSSHIPTPLPEALTPDLDGKTILITGGAGFIGSSLVAYFRAHHKNARVIVLDKFRDGTSFPSGNPSSLGHFKNLLGFDGDILALDINDGLGILQNLHFDYVLHQAAISDTTLENQKLMIQTNHHAFLELLHIALKKGAKVVYASSAGTYGNSSVPNIVGVGEEPENIYGFSKLAMDTSVRKILSSTPQAPIVGLRYFNVYGAREYYKGKTASMILQLALQALESKKVRLFEFGQQQRDFVYIDDVVWANVLAMQVNKGGIYNVGYGVSRSYNDIIAILRQELFALGEDLGNFEVEYIKNPYGFFQNHTQADIGPTTNDLGYKPAFDLESGIKAYMPEIYAIFQRRQNVAFA